MSGLRLTHSRKAQAGIADSQVDITSEKDTYRISTKNTKIRNIEYGTAGKKPFKQSEVSLVGDALVAFDAGLALVI